MVSVSGLSGAMRFAGSQTLEPCSTSFLDALAGAGREEEPLRILSFENHTLTVCSKISAAVSRFLMLTNTNIEKGELPIT